MKRNRITMIGLVLSILGYPFVLVVKNRLALSNTISEQNLSLLGLFFVWVIVILLMAMIMRGEKRPFSSIGIKPITGKEILEAIIIGIVLSLTVPLLTWLVSQIMPTQGGGINEVVTNRSWWILLLSVLTAGIAEEIIFRGYIIERIEEITDIKWVAALVSIIAFVLPHALSWNSTHLLAVVLPLGLALTGIYLWKRNLIFTMIVHTVIDLPLVFFALMST